MVKIYKYLFKYVNANILFFCLFFVVFPLATCTSPEPIIITSIVNNCNPPYPLDYLAFNEEKYNKEIEKLIAKWPPDLQNYLKLKIQNRIIQHERCISQIEQHKIYEQCLLSLINEKEIDSNNQ